MAESEGDPVSADQLMRHLRIPRLKVGHALSFLDELKDAFVDQPQVYSEFLDVMKAFKACRYVYYLYMFIS